MKQDQTYKTEVVEIILPSNNSSDHIFSDKYEVIITRDTDGNKLVLLKEKNEKR